MNVNSFRTPFELHTCELVTRILVCCYHNVLRLRRDEAARAAAKAAAAEADAVCCEGASAASASASGAPQLPRRRLPQSRPESFVR